MNGLLKASDSLRPTLPPIVTGMGKELPVFHIRYQVRVREWIIEMQPSFTSYDLRYPHPEPGLEAAVGYVRWVTRDGGCRIIIRGKRKIRIRVFHVPPLV